MRLRTSIAPIALTATLALGLAACGDDPDPAATTEDEMTEEDEMTDEDMTDDDMSDDDMSDEEG